MKKAPPGGRQHTVYLLDVGLHDVGLHMNEGIPTEDQIYGSIRRPGQGLAIRRQVLDMSLGSETLSAGFQAGGRQVHDNQAVTEIPLLLGGTCPSTWVPWDSSPANSL